VSVWGTSDPTGLTGDADDGSGGTNTSNAPVAPSPAYPVAGAPDTSGILGDILASASPGAFDPTTLATVGGGAAPTPGIGDILSLLLGSGSGGGIGSGSGAGNILAQLLGPLFGINQGGSSAEGGQIGGLAGGALGSLLGPGGSLAGSAIGDLLGNLLGGAIGGGLNKFAKPQGLTDLLKSSGNPLETLLGRYIQTQGTDKGYDLSEPQNATPFQPRRFGDVLELLSGQGLPNQVGGNVGTQNSVYLSGWKNLGALQSMVPNATNLTSAQLQQIFPEIATLVNKSKAGGLKGLLEQENTLATKLKAAESY